MIVDYYRKAKENYVDINDDIAPSQEEEDESIYDELNCCVDSFLEELPSQYANSLRAVYLDEYTQKEYAALNDIKLSTVKSQVKRGKESMKEFFESCCSFEKDSLNKINACKPKDTKCSSC